jgi:diguanylate cyclase (GGDEF)-like protein
LDSGALDSGALDSGALDSGALDSDMNNSAVDVSQTHENLDARDRPTFTMTFTAGVAVYPHDGSDLQGLYRAADQALYKAKSAGRNRVYSAR